MNLRQPIVIMLPGFPGEYTDTLVRPSARVARLPGQVFLDGHPDAQDLVIGRIGDAKTAVPQQAFNYITLV